MTRAQIRDKLRRRIQEEVGDPAGGWTDTELNAEINDAYSWVQKEVFKVDREAHLFWDTMDLTSGTSWYPLPNTFGIVQVSTLENAAATVYDLLKRKTYQDIQQISSTEAYYTQRGQWIGIFPVPTVSITNGIELVHSPIMSLSEDTDIPRIKTPLHEAIVLKSKSQILGDLDQDSPKNRQDLVDLVNDLPLWYDMHSDEPDRLSPRGL